MNPPPGSLGRTDPQLLACVLAHHGIAAVVLRDGSLAWANERARRAVTDPAASTRASDDELDELLRRNLQIEGLDDPLEPGESRSVLVRLATHRVLLEREGLATGIDGVGSAMITFGVDAAEETDPAHVTRLETMLEATADIIAVIDGEGRVRFSNAAGRRLTGLTGQDVNGQPITDLVHPDDVEAVLESFLSVVAGEGLDDFEFRLRHADGSFHPVEAAVPAEVTIDGLPAYVVTVRDISDRIEREAEQQSARRRLEALVENLDDVIVVLGGDLGVKWASPGIERLVDAPAYTNVGEHAFNDIHPDDVGAVIETVQGLSGHPGASSRIEFRLRHQRRGWRWVETAVVNRLEDPDIEGFVCTLRDITDQRDVDAELRRLHEQDRREVTRLRETDKLKDLFLDTVSHELRTPLASVHGFSGLLATRGPDLDEESRTDFAQRIHANALEMQRMVDQLLELSRLQAGRVQLELARISLDEVVDELLDHLRTQLDGHEVSAVTGGLSVVADRRGLDYILRNLLTNAARYSEPGTRIDVAAERRDDEVVVRVHDQGVGISADDKVRIFQSFYQAGPAPTGGRGIGIGLNIARRYAQLLSGRLQVDSEPGVGSTFSVTLPAAD